MPADPPCTKASMGVLNFSTSIDAKLQAAVVQEANPIPIQFGLFRTTSGTYNKMFERGDAHNAIRVMGFILRHRNFSEKFTQSSRRGAKKKHM